MWLLQTRSARFLPPDRVDAFSEALGVPPETLNGAGESQIVGPDGKVLAIGPVAGEAVVIAEVDLSDVDPGRLSGRRPEVYAPLAQAHTAQPASGLASEVVVACVPGARQNPELIDEAFDSGVSLVILPELTRAPATIPEGVLVVTTALREDQTSHIQHGHIQHGHIQHRGQVWSAQGLVHEQPQIHRSDRYPKVTDLGSDVDLYRTPFGDLAVLVADDHRYPEAVRLAAVAGAHIVVVCWQPEHLWEWDLALVERAAENRVSLAACGPAGSAGAAIMLDPPADSLWESPAIKRLRRHHQHSNNHSGRARRRVVDRHSAPWSSFGSGGFQGHRPSRRRHPSQNRSGLTHNRSVHELAVENQCCSALPPVPHTQPQPSQHEQWHRFHRNSARCPSQNRSDLTHNRSVHDQCRTALSSRGFIWVADRGRLRRYSARCPSQNRSG